MNAPFRIAHRQIGGGEAELNLPAHHFQALAGPHVELGIEVGNLAAEPNTERTGVKQVDQADTADPRGQRRPHGIATDADWTDHSHAGNDHFTLAAHAQHPTPIAAKLVGQRPTDPILCATRSFRTSVPLVLAMLVVSVVLVMAGVGGCRATGRD